MPTRPTAALWLQQLITDEKSRLSPRQRETIKRLSRFQSGTARKTDRKHDRRGVNPSPRDS